MRHKVRAANSVCMRFAGCCRSFICPCHLGCIVDFIKKSMRHKTMAFQRHFLKISTMTKNNLIFLGEVLETERKRKKKKTGRAKARTYLQCILAEEFLYRKRKWNDVHLA